MRFTFIKSCYDVYLDLTPKLTLIVVLSYLQGKAPNRKKISTMCRNLRYASTKGVVDTYSIDSPIAGGNGKVLSIPKVAIV